MAPRILLALILAVLVVLIAGVVLLGPAMPWSSHGEPEVRMAIGAVADPVELPPVAGPDDPSAPLVVIDAGHGGRDLGAVSRGPNGEEVFEKQIVLAIATAVRDELLERGGVRVAMTRSEDVIVPLARRPEIARALGADLFLSIHADSAGEYSDVAGASIYTLSREASSEAAARFAARENAADRVNGIAVEGQSAEVNAILVELSQQRTQGEAAEFAGLIEREGRGEIAFHPQTRRSAALAVLRAPDVPGVLFESGFVTNEADRIRLTTPEGQMEYAEALAQAIRVYFARRTEP
ncbi:MAG: N-acetylmuramoyl-L-alanine amidase [Erythrobacter sp.]